MDITKSKIVISTHYLVYGASHALREYLISKGIKELLFIAHPLEGGSGYSYWEWIENGEVKNDHKSFLRTNMSLINYLIEAYLTFIWIAFRREKFSLFVGVDNLNAVIGIILRALGKVNTVVYYTIDYSPKRFKNRFLNYLHHKIDYFCCQHVDLIWNVSPRMAEGRKERWKIDFDKQQVVPIGVWFERITRKPFSEIKRYQVLFIGHLLKKQGVQLVISAIPSIIKSVPDFHFLVVGGGPYQAILEEQAKKLGLEKYITFTGWIKDRERIDKLMSDSACALAPYDPTNAGFSYYADPTKIKDYLSAGLPIILTDVPYNAKEIVRRGCGIIVDYEKDDIARVIISLIQDDKKLLFYREKALEYAKELGWERIFDSVFGEL